MAKVMLIMDEPKDCLHCKLRMCIHIGEKFYQHCGFDTSGYCRETYFKEEDLKDGFISKYCPLRPVPEKKDICGTYNGEYYKNGGKPPSWKCGYNACISEILKE